MISLSPSESSCAGEGGADHYGNRAGQAQTGQDQALIAHLMPTDRRLNLQKSDRLLDTCYVSGYNVYI